MPGVTDAVRNRSAYRPFTSEDLLQVIYAFNVMNRKEVQFSSTLTGS